MNRAISSIRTNRREPVDQDENSLVAVQDRCGLCPGKAVREMYLTSACAEYRESGPANQAGTRYTSNQERQFGM